VKHGARLSDGRVVTRDLVGEISREQRDKLKGGRITTAAEIFQRMMTSEDFTEFLTLEAYDYID
jgi:malate synthase